MAGTLFVVSTPIGNLEDVTLRSLRVLREVDLIAAEDTRRTGHLLARHGIASRTISFHQHNVRSRLPWLLSRLMAGDSVAVVTDAGTPGISDPGVELVQACVAAGIAVDPVPGASAPFAAAVASGFPLVPLTILGFPPRRSKDRTRWVDALLRTHHTVTFFESPLRISGTLSSMANSFGDRPICVARELSKVHQEFLRGTASNLSLALSGKKGEMTVVVAPLQTPTILPIDQTQSPNLGAVVEYFGQMTNDVGMSRRDALKRTAKRFGLPSRKVYDLIEAAKKSGL